MEELYNFIKRNRIKNALDLLERKAKNEDQKLQAIQLGQKWDALKRKERMGVLRNQEAGVQQAQIVSSILELGRVIEEFKELPPEDISSPKPTSNNDKIFFSYAWGLNDETGKNREELVDQLYDSLEADGIDVIRDKKDLNYGEFISDFMEQIGKGDLIIVFTSEKYAKSPYCMFELYEIARNSKWEIEAFRQQILPVIVEYVPFNEPKTLIEYLNYWKAKQEEWEQLIKIAAAQLGDHQLDEYSKIKKINQNFGDLVGWLGDINASNNELLAENDFELIKQTILQRLGASQN